MKKLNYILLFIISLTVISMKAQQEKESKIKEFKFNIIAYGGIGDVIIKNENESNYNMNSDGGDLLINYKINKIFGIATGIGLYNLSGSGFNSIGNFYHERIMLKIPLLATLNYPIAEKTKIVAKLGFYTQNIVNDEYQFLNSSQKDIYSGWSSGVQVGFGFLFELFNHFNAGINLNGQSDFSYFKTNNNQGINDKQKLKTLNSVGVILMFDI